MTLPRASRLAKQCAELGWQLQVMEARKVDSRTWSIEGFAPAKAEALVASVIGRSADDCAWCEGGSLNLVMKCAALDVLARHNFHGTRADALNRYLEAQLSILEDRLPEIHMEVLAVSEEAMARNVREVFADGSILGAYPRARPEFVLALWQALGREAVARILAVFGRRPYDYRAGWPDITVLEGGSVRFVEVKTTDHLLDSQLRFAREIATPLQLACSVVQLKPSA